jgi:ribosome-associated translation inhibitor RaiA
MPDGVIKWVDSKSGEAVVMRGGRMFPTRVKDIESVARRSGARVHFDIHRERGVDRAVDVRLRAGTHVSHHHRRFGTLTGARGVDAKGAKPSAQLHPELRTPAQHPVEVARAWSTSLACGDVDGALTLYSPDATVHVGEQAIVGRGALAEWLASTSPFGSQRHALIRGSDKTVTVSWPESGPEEPGLVVRCQIKHLQIAEQWAEVPEPAPRIPVAGEALPPVLDLSTSGEVDDEARHSAQETIVRTIQKLNEPVLLARLRLGWEPDPARLRPATAQASLDIDGDVVRAHVAARTMPEAIDLLEQRLRDRIEHRSRRREQLHRSSPSHEPGEWRHGDLPSHRPGYFDRPVEDRQLVRHKTFAVDELTSDEAVFDMEQLDYDFYLFRDLASGSDSLVERLEDGSYRLTRAESTDVDLRPLATDIALSETPAPVLDLEEAIERLNAGNEPHVFFVDSASGRGSVLYRRYDGHYGLITSD